MNRHMLILIILFMFTIPEVIYSMPRFSVKLGNKCIDCHYNPTGGNMRSLDGWNWGKNTLSMISTRDKDFTMSPKLNDNISIGVDYRTQFLYSQEKNRSDFQQMTGSAYTNIAISRDIKILGRYDFVNQLWEGYLAANIFPDKSYIKAGSFSPNYGIRIDDHTAYTRGGDFGLLFSTGAYRGLIYNPLYTEAGIEAGYYGGDFLFATVSAGANLLTNRTLSKDPTYTARIELTPGIKGIGLMFGGSFAAAHVPEAVNMYGGFIGIGFSELVIMGEYDIADDLMGSNIKSNVMMLQASYGLFTGLEAIIRYDRIDPNDNMNGDNVAHLIAGVEFQPFQFIEIRPQYRFILEDPSIKNDAFVLQFHFWY